MINKGISLFSLLQVLTIFVIIGILGMFSSQGCSLYINRTTINIAIVLGVEIFFVFRDAKKNNNQLLFVLAYWTLLYCLIRVLTLNYTDFSVPLRRSGASVEDVNITLIIYFISTSVLWIILHKPQSKNLRNVNLEYSKTSVNRAIKLFWIALIINIVADAGVPILGGIAVILKQFVINVFYLLIMMVIYILLLWKNIDKKVRYSLIICLFAFVIYLTLGGSRSGIITIGRIILLTCIVLGYKRIKIKYVLGVACLVPIAVFLFLFSTAMRQLDMVDTSLSDKLSIASTIIQENSEIEPKLVLAPICDRIGFLDMTTEMYCQKNQFATFINIPRELMSIVDNALTPGFDVFDVPRVSHVISNSYEFSDDVIFTKSKNSAEDYHSDELTLYGESVILLGMPLCFILITIVGVIFKKYWAKCDLYNDERCYILKGVGLLMFEKLLSSYGIDWFVLDIVCITITYIIFKRYVLSVKKTKVQGPMHIRE